ncbi:MAG: hypothetical protein JWN25_2901 [Verrucomicrobiales bacterium]|jgi:uncharacterized membrane protein YqjE|nr:hypothetical protein [Verrucomicrobiales bacterium]MDB6131749.1 hypothetical protein [Verrucomicrobiales bacterium]
MLQAILNSSGVVGSVRRMTDTVLAVIHNRLELASLELKEEKGRVIGLLIWAVAAIFFGLMSVVALMLLLLFVFWDNKVAVAIGLSGFFLVATLAAFFALKSKLKNPPIPFAETINQLKKDRAWLKSQV